MNPIKNIVVNRLGPSFQKLFTNFSKESIRIHATNTSFELVNMRLRPGVNELIPNVDIRSGFIGSVYGKVHLSQLSKAPFSFDIRDAYFLVTTPEVDPSPAATKRRIHQEKDRLYRRFRDFDRKYAIEEPDSVSSTLESAIAIFRTKLVDYLVNSNVSMKRVHIRYEDATDISSPQGFGFLLDSMSIKTTNELWRKPVNRADVTGYKLAQFNGLSVYWTQGFLSTDGTDVINKLHEISQDRTHLKGFHMIIDNLCAVLKMKFTKPYLLEKRPLIDTSCYIKSLTIHVGEQQLNPIITMLLNTSTSDEKQHYQNIRPFTGRLGIDTLRKSQSLDELKHQKSQSSRPLQSEQSILPAPPSAFTTTLRSLVTERSRLLWGWAIFCVLKDVRQRRQSADLKFIVTQRRKDRLQYIVGRMEWINALEQIQTGTIPARFWTNESVERTKHLVRARLQKTYELYWLNMVEQEAENTVTNKPIVASEEHVKEIARLKTIVDTEWKKTQRMEKLPDLAFLSRGSEHRYQSKSSVHGSASSVDEKALQNWEKQMLKDQQVTNSRFKIDGDDPITPMNPRDLKELGIDAVNLMKMIELENSYPYDDIIYFRTIADSQAIAEGRGWVAEKEKEDDVLVDDRALTMRELRKSRETEKTEVSIVSDSLPSELPSDNSDVPSDNSDSPIEINVNTLSEQEIVDIEDDLPPIFIPIKLISNNVDVNSQASSPSQSTNNHDHFSPISPSSGPTTPVNSARTRSTQLPYQPQPSVDKSWSLFRINYTIDTFSTILYESPTNSALQSGRWSSFHPLVDLKFVNITGSFGYRPISRGMDLVMCIDDGIIQDISRRRENLYKTLFRKLPQSINEARTESPTFFTPTSTPGLPPITASPHTFSNSNQPMKPPPEPINPLIRIEFSTNPVNSWSVILTHMSVAASQNVLSPALLLRLAHTFQSIFLFRNLPPNNTRPDEATTENTNRQTPHPPFTRLPFSQTEEQQQLTRQFLTLLDTIPTTLLDNVLHRLPLDLIIQVGQFDVIVPLHSDSAKTDSILFSFDSFHFIADSSQLKSSAINPSTSAKSMRKRSVFSNLLFSSSASSSREQQRFLQTHPILSKTAFGLPPFPPIEWYDNPDDWTIENLFDQYHMSLSGLRLGITDVEVSAEDPDLDEVDTEAVTYSSANLEEQVVVTFDPDKIQWLCENITVESTIQFSLFQHSSLIPQRLIFVNIGEISLIVNKDHIVRFLNIVKNLVPLFTNQTERLASLFPEQSSHFPSEDQFRAILLDTQDYSRINKALSRSIPAMPPNRLLYNMSVLRKHLQVCFIEKTKFGTKTIRQHIKSEDVVVRALHGTVGLISLRVGSEVTSYAKETRAPYTIQVEFRLVEMSLLYRLLSRSGELSVGNINVTHPTPSGPQSLFSRLHLVTDPHPLIKNLQDTHQPKQFPLTFQFDDGNGLPIIPPFTARTLSLIQLSRVRESSHTPPWIQKYLRRISPPDHIDLVQPTPTPFSIPIPTTPIVGISFEMNQAHSVFRKNERLELSILINPVVERIEQKVYLNVLQTFLTIINALSSFPSSEPCVDKTLQVKKTDPMSISITIPLFCIHSPEEGGLHELIHISNLGISSSFSPLSNQISAKLGSFQISQIEESRTLPQTDLSFISFGKEANLHPIQNNPPFEDILPHDAVHLSLSTNRDDTTKQRLQIELGPLFGRVDGETIGFMSGIVSSIMSVARATFQHENTSPSSPKKKQVPPSSPKITSLFIHSPESLSLMILANNRNHDHPHGIHLKMKETTLCSASSIFQMNAISIRHIQSKDSDSSVDLSSIAFARNSVDVHGDTSINHSDVQSFKTDQYQLSLSPIQISTNSQTYSSLKHFVALMPFLVRTGKANHFRYNRVERSQNEWKKQKNLEDSVLNSFTCSRDFHIDVKLDQVLWNHQLSHSSSDGSIFSRISSSPLSLSIQSSTSGPDPTAKILIRNGDVSIQISDRTSCPLIDSELVGISMDLILQMKTSTRGGLISPPIFGCSMAGSFCIDTPRSNHSHNRLPLLTPAKFSMRVTSPNQDGCLFNSDQSVDTPHSYQQRIIERRDSYCLSMNFEDLIKIALTPRTVETLAHIIHLVTMQADPPDGVLMSDNPALINICLMNQTPYALFAQPQSSQTVESEDEKCINNTTLRICPDSTSHIHLTLDTKQTPMHFFVRFALLAFDIVPQFITESSLRWTPTISLTFSDSQRMLAIRSPLENGGRFITLLISNHLISKNYCSIRICEVHRTVSPLVPRMPVHNLSEFLQKDHDTSDSFLHPTLSSSVTLQNATRFSATIAEHDEKDNTLELLPFSSSDMSFSTSSQESIDITFSLRGQSSSLTISPTQEDPTSHIFHVDGIDEEVLVTTQSSSGRTTIICKLASDQEEYTPNLPLFLIHTSLMIPQLSLQVFSEPIENPFLSITLPDLRFLVSTNTFQHTLELTSSDFLLSAGSPGIPMTTLISSNTSSQLTPFFLFRASFGSHSPVPFPSRRPSLLVHLIQFRLSPIKALLSESVILHTETQLKSQYLPAIHLLTRKRETSTTTPLNRGRMKVRHMFVDPISISLTVQTSSSPSSHTVSFLGTVGFTIFHTLGSLTTTLFFHGFSASPNRSSFDDLIIKLKRHYLVQVIQNTPRLLAGLDLIGSPLTIVNAFVVDYGRLRGRNPRWTDYPKQFLVSLLKEGSHAILRMTEAVSVGVLTISLVPSQTPASLSPPKQELSRTIEAVSSSISQGSRELLHSFTPKEPTTPLSVLSNIGQGALRFVGYVFRASFSVIRTPFRVILVLLPRDSRRKDSEDKEKEKNG